LVIEKISRTKSQAPNKSQKLILEISSTTKIFNFFILNFIGVCFLLFGSCFKTFAAWKNF